MQKLSGPLPLAHMFTSFCSQLKRYEAQKSVQTCPRPVEMAQAGMTTETENWLGLSSKSWRCQEWFLWVHWVGSSRAICFWPFFALTKTTKKEKSQHKVYRHRSAHIYFKYKIYTVIDLHFSKVLCIFEALLEPQVWKPQWQTKVHEHFNGSE